MEPDRSGPHPPAPDRPELTLRHAPPAFRPYLLLAGRADPLPLPIAEGATLIIGRSRQANLRLTDPRVSRLHARIVIRGGEPHVEDLGSVLGTWLNGRQLHGLRRLRRKDTLTIGSEQITCHSLADELREAGACLPAVAPQPPSGPPADAARAAAAARRNVPGQGRTHRLDTAIAAGAIASAILCIAWLTCIVVSA